jgi:hypothetical protein
MEQRNNIDMYKETKSPDVPEYPIESEIANAVRNMEKEILGQSELLQLFEEKAAYVLAPNIPSDLRGSDKDPVESSPLIHELQRLYRFQHENNIKLGNLLNRLTT